MIPIKTESAWRGTSDCRQCGIRDMVLFADLNEHDFAHIHAPIDDLEFAHGVVLYAEGSPVQGIFTLRSGMVKLVRDGIIEQMDKEGRIYFVRQAERLSVE